MAGSSQPLMDALPERISKKISISPVGCWEWVGAVQGNGYGRVWDGGSVTYAHRLVYTLTTGKIGSGLDIDHLCRNRKCVNPAHLEPVCRSTNIRRGECGRLNTERARLITKCKRGHAFTEENTRLYNGKRHCRACARLHYNENKVKGTCKH